MQRLNSRSSEQLVELCQLSRPLGGQQYLLLPGPLQFQLRGRGIHLGNLGGAQSIAGDLDKACVQINDVLLRLELFVQYQQAVIRARDIARQLAFGLTDLGDRQRNIDARDILLARDASGNRKILAETDADGILAVVAEHGVITPRQLQTRIRCETGLHQACTGNLDGVPRGLEILVVLKRCADQLITRQYGRGR